MKLTIVILGMCGFLMGEAALAAKPVKKPVAKAAAKAAPRAAATRTTAARPVAKAASAVRPGTRPAAAPQARAVAGRPSTAAAPARTTAAARAPAAAAAPATAAAKTSAQDTSGLAASIRSMSTAPTMGGGGMMRGPSGAHEIGEAMRVTGQSRNLSMGLLFSKDNDKIEFGNPRMHYKDKISSRQANY